MKNNELILSILTEFKSELGKDFERYSNHASRVFLLCTLSDAKEENQEKYAIAAAFHDLGIWTNKTFDYLKPSIELSSKYLQSEKRQEWVEEISLMIDMHHKRSKYKGDFQRTVETFRRADWMDVTKGRKSFGLSKAEYQKIVNEHPTLGFHKFLVIQTLKNFFKSPLNPLPMFKR